MQSKFNSKTMKQMILVLSLAVLTCCGTAQNKDVSKGSATVTEQEQTQQEQTMKVLVTYFSASGVTRNVARQLADIFDADLFEITPEQLYTDADLDWRDKTSRSTIEMNDKSSRPAIKDGGKVPNLDQYDVVYVGFPIWWYTAPTIINTFIEANDFTGKTIVPFATSGGSTIEKACEDLQAAYPTYKFGKGRLLNHIDNSEIEKWAVEIK